MAVSSKLKEEKKTNKVEDEIICARDRDSIFIAMLYVGRVKNVTVDFNVAVLLFMALLNAECWLAT